MLIISYDISNDKLRGYFSKFLSKFGFRLQYSVYEIQNSDRILKNIQTEIENSYAKHFTQSDSVVILELSKTCKKTTYGYAKNNDADFMLIS